MLAVSYHACNAMKEILNNLLINVIAGKKKRNRGRRKKSANILIGIGVVKE